MTIQYRPRARRRQDRSGPRSTPAAHCPGAPGPGVHRCTICTRALGWVGSGAGAVLQPELAANHTATLPTHSRQPVSTGFHRPRNSIKKYSGFYPPPGSMPVKISHNRPQENKWDSYISQENCPNIFLEKSLLIYFWKMPSGVEDGLPFIYMWVAFFLPFAQPVRTLPR